VESISLSFLGLIMFGDEIVQASALSEKTLKFCKKSVISLKMPKLVAYFSIFFPIHIFRVCLKAAINFSNS
jgi:hypothetical protein